MAMTNQNKEKILIVDDSEMNRAILSDILGDEYVILEAENGAQAMALLKQMNTDISLVLLDIVMPEMDGFELLSIMNEYKWIDNIPVIMISAETSSSYVEWAYELGVTDFISRPFDALIVRRRAINTIMLYAKQRKLISMVTDQIYEREKSNSLMVSILSHIVEFRNGESGSHVLHIRTMTRLLIRSLIKKTDHYQISRQDMSLIPTASALHDIGKITIPDEILNKPGRLTDEEFAIMKTHTVTGAAMLEDLSTQQNAPLVRTAAQICRWHHERYDGQGYPDGLKGEEIPIAAQIVSLADVYDALTSERVYKPAFSSEKAIQMILNGECGAFNPLLLECLTEQGNKLLEELGENSSELEQQQEIREISEEILRHDELSTSERTLRLLEHERMKYQFFASMSREVQFEYTSDPAVVILSEWGARHLGLPETITSPLQHPDCIRLTGKDTLWDLANTIRNSSPEEQDALQFDFQMNLNGKMRWHRCIFRATWSGLDTPQYVGCIGKVIDIHDEHIQMEDLQHRAYHDALTGLWNRSYAVRQIDNRLICGRRFALAILDLDHFKSANDLYGHAFGDEILKYTAERLRRCVRNNDLVARIGGDEFLIFFEYHNDLPQAIDRIFHQLIGEYEGFQISVSVGVAITDEAGYDYDVLFRHADRALYAGKRRGRSQYCFYDESMKDMLSAVSLIDDSPDEHQNQNQNQVQTQNAAASEKSAS